MDQPTATQNGKLFYPITEQTDLLLQSIQSTMNELYPFVQTVIKNYSHEALNKLIQQLQEHPGDNNSQLFNCNNNEEYAIKRLITAMLSRDGDVKFNAYMTLTTILNKLPHLQTALNVKGLAQFILSQSDIVKHCGGKAADTQAYLIGKILIVKALRSILKDNIQIINHLIELAGQNNEFEEQIIELVSQMISNKKTQLIFSKMSPNTKAGFVLFNILRSKLKGTQCELNEAAIQDVLAELIPQYPRRSICLVYLGSYLNLCVQNPATFLQSNLQSALGTEEQEPNVKKIFYILQLLQSHLSEVVITKQNSPKTITPQLIGSWLSQLRVQNKYIRKQAQNVKITFDKNEELAFEILKEIHSAKIDLSNINIKHPLYALLQMVKPENYFEYLLELCNTENSSIETDEEPVPLPFAELQIFIAAAHKTLKAESLAKAIQLLVNGYHNNKDESHLQTLNSVFNSVLPHSHKKKQSLLVRQSLILSKLNFDNLEMGETLLQMKTAIKEIRNMVKQNKEEQDPFVISYLNFLINVGFYFLMYPEEVQIFEDLKMAFQELKNSVLNQQSGLIPKKKKKLNAGEEKNKAVQILVDIFISLLTKSPQFMRSSINHLFEHIIPNLDTSDLSHLLEVVQRPDQEYIQEIENE